MFRNVMEENDTLEVIWNNKCFFKKGGEKLKFYKNNIAKIYKLVYIVSELKFKEAFSYGNISEKKEYTTF